MLIGFSFFKLIIFLRYLILSSIFNKLSCFKDFSKFKHFSFKNVQSIQFFNTKYKTKNIFIYFKLFKSILKCGNYFIYNIQKVIDFK